MTKFLLDHGADVNARDDKDYTPLHYAATCDTQSVQWLIAAGADIYARSKAGRTPLHAAILENQSETARILIKHKARTDVLDIDGKSPLDYAYESGNGELLNALRGEEGGWR